MTQSPELQNRINQWKQKALDGTITLEEMKAAILYMREDRKKSATSSESKPRTTRAKAPARSADDLLSELDGL